MYRVTTSFVDLETGKRYEVGDTYESSPERIKALSTSNNRRGIALIKKIEEEPKKKTKKKKDK